MTNQQRLALLPELHEKENKLNQQISKIDKTLKGFEKTKETLLKKKESLKIQISKNMKFRNELIKEIEEENA